MVRVLAYMVKEYDKDKMDMFTTVSRRHCRSKNSTQFREELDLITPTGTTDINYSLGRILQDYEGKLRRAGLYRQNPPFWSHKVKPMNLYVLTDAIWEQHSDAKQPIESLVETMKELRYPQNHVGIQFVRFGDNPECIKKLRELDDAKDLAMYVHSPLHLRHGVRVETCVADDASFIGTLLIPLQLLVIFGRCSLARSGSHLTRSGKSNASCRQRLEIQRWSHGELNPISPHGQ